MKFLSQIALWNALPNLHYATFYNVWTGSRIAPKHSTTGCAKTSPRCVTF
ncbi:hypothetical protein ACPOL_5823 [Acidisarcina polymorpha]|uniref:Uncharacterized protein n=1 Tax=Acidisarcina polymorpha TaxID=2211140 RepID=A0A2Z5G8C2_9BACT|nr:hypothetical protein [Acidisarcina polymorpha]AXC15067.1 hypothetical protein ACPOL_5823 [Acidisarcina polymorpha]